jgi:hypothetical protein
MNCLLPLKHRDHGFEFHSRYWSSSWVFASCCVCEIRWWGLLYPYTQRHYRRLILILVLLHVSVVRPSSSKKILLLSNPS